MTPEQKQQRINEIADRSQHPHRNKPTWADVNFLLSLVESQAKLAHELALIVDVGTCDDPGTALSKLHKIQHVAATSMRSACVEKLRERANRYQKLANDSLPNDQTAARTAAAAAALNSAAKELESVSIEEQEAKQS